MLVRSFILFIILATFSLSVQGHLTPFPVSAPSEPIALQPGEEVHVPIQIEIPPNFFVYQEKTKLTIIDLKGFDLQTIAYPESRIRQDPFFKKEMAVFEGNIQITPALKAPADMGPGRKIIEALVKLQGCSDVLCYPEESHLVSFQLDIAGGAVAGTAGSQPTPTLSELLSAQHFAEIFGQSLGIILLVVFLGGFLTSLTPCVLPVIPITLMIIGVRSDRHWSHNLALSAVLVLGLALSYALLGVLAVSLGKGLGFVFQQKWVVTALAVLFFLLALSMFGLFEIHLPQFIRQRLNQIHGHGLWGAFLSGGAAGVLAAPCAGPVVGALLLYVAGTQSYLQGFGLLFWYALGMGLLFVVLGTGYGTLQARFTSLQLTVWVKRFLGLLLLAGSLFYLNAVFPLQKSFEGLLKRPDPVAWLSREAQGLERARTEHKIMLVDFYADWCPPCKELEIGFFRKPEVVALLKRMVPVRIDATFMDEEVARLLEKYHVVGWPTIKFVSPDGQILDELTVVSYHPQVLLENMKKSLSHFKFAQ